MSPALQENFDKAVQLAGDPNLGGKWSLSNNQRLAMYGCYKQVNVGPCPSSEDRPGMFQPTARSKYDAWKAHSGLSKQEAMEEYVSIAEKFW